MAMNVGKISCWFWVFFLIVSIAYAASPAVGNIQTPPFPVEARAINSSASIRPCEVAAFAFSLYNPGPEEEIVDLGAYPAFDSVYFSMNPVTLSSTQSKEVTLFVVPACEEYGTFNVELLARSRTTMKQAATLIGLLEISPDGIVEIAKGVSRVRVDYNKSGTTIPMKNIGGIDSVYDISIGGPGWISIKPSSVSLPAGESGEFMLITMPGSDVKQGTYRITLFAKSRETGVEYGKALQIVLSPITEEEMQWNRLKPWLIIALVIASALILLLVLILIYLIRTREERARARQEHLAKAAKLSAEKEAAYKDKIKSGKETWALRIRAWFKRKLSSENVLVRRSDNSVVRRWPWRLAKILLFVLIVAVIAVTIWWFWAVLSPYAWVLWAIIAVIFAVILIIWLLRRMAFNRWMARFTSHEIDEIKDEAREELEEEFVLIPKADYKAVIRNRGSRVVQKIFSLMESGEIYSIQTGWPEGIAEISVKIKSDKEGVVLSCIRHKDNPAFVTPEGVVYQFAEVKSSGLQERDISELNVKFNINKSWLAKHNCAENDVTLVRYSPSRSRWVKSEGVEPSGSSDKSVLFIASLNSVGYLAIIAKPKGVAEEEPGFFKRLFQGSEEKEEGPSIEDEIATRKAARDAAKKEETRLREEERKKAELKALLAGQERKGWGWLRWLMMLILLLLAIVFIVVMVWYFNPALMPPAVASWLGMESPTHPLVAGGNTTEVLPVTPIANDTRVAPVTNDTVAAPSRVGIPDQAWPKNTVHTADLSQWFKDPDGDVLAYSNTPLKNIVIEYNDSIAAFTPNQGWAGEESTVFTATDKAGASASSTAVRLVVQAGQGTTDGTLVEFAKAYWAYIASGLVVLGVIIILIVIMRRGEKEEPPAV